ncbi:MAG: T9SS type A sorting domain-containing protein [Bacteroidales bacterium]|jgi:1,4-alpha-glucan branching enzyme|nr:T9SS type A sorting domain-containing protein [Bacteroidales bacterium]
MKRLLSLVLVFTLCHISAQVVTTVPSMITVQHNSEIQIIFNAAEGNGGLKDYSGDVYAHTGVITDKSTTGSDWKYAPAWGTNTEKYKLQPLGNNLWKLLITPDMRTYYGVVAEDTIKKLAFVFRSSDNSKEGKDVAGADIFVDVLNAELSVTFATPTQRTLLINKNDSVTFTVNSLLSTSLSLSIDGVQAGTTAETSLTVKHKFTAEGNHNAVATASDGVNTVTDTIFVCVPQNTIQQPIPSGLQDGITVYYGTDSATLILYAPYKEQIFLIGDFNNWNIDNNYLMKKDGDRFWITLHGLNTDKEYAFQYLVDGAAPDGGIRTGDPYCTKILDPWNDKWITASVYPNLQAYPQDKTNGTVSVFSTAQSTYNWQINDFVKPPKEQLIIYELLLRDFTEQGTVKAAEEKLDYLKSLGINAIELMPIMEFDGNDSWGYNPNFYFASDKAYGTPNDYKHFIDECHKRGIAVILDIVFNHCWGESPLVKLWWDGANSRPAADNPYANPIPKHPYNVGSDLNHESPATRSYFKRVLKYWLNEYKFDGYRFDLSKGLTQKNSGENVTLWGQKDTSRIDIIRDYQNTIENTDGSAYIILEHFAENSEEIILANDGMILWNNMNYAFCQSAMGYSQGSDFDAIVPFRRGFVKPNLVSYMESHDEERVGYKMLQWGNWNMAASPNMRALRAGLSAAFMLLAQGPKMIWQFGEMNYDVSIDYNDRTGRKPLHWEYLENADGKYVHNMYSNILALRNNFSEIFSGVHGKANFSYQLGSIDYILRIFTYTSDSVNVVLIGNFSNDTITATVKLPELPQGKRWYNYLQQTDALIESATPDITVAPHRLLLLIDTLTPLVETYKDLDVANEISQAAAAAANATLEIYPNPVTEELNIAGINKAGYCKIYSMQGKCVLNGKVQKNGKINIETLAKGVYIIEMNGKSAKFVKQ